MRAWGLAWLVACAGSPGGGDTVLRFVPAEPGQDVAWARDAVAYTLGAAGATTAPDGVEVVDDERVIVRANALGLADVGPLAAVNVALADSGEAEAFGAVDLGRWLTLVVTDPWTTYALTGVCETLDDWRDGAQGERYAVTASALVAGHRVLERLPGSEPIGDRWLALDGDGRVDDGTFSATSAHTIDVQPNGRLRFASYDAEGVLEAGHAPAGGPDRCAWCHEDQVMRVVDQPDVPGFAPWSDAIAAMTRQQDAIVARRVALGWDGDLQAHTDPERVVDAFLEPDAARLAHEWDVPVAAAEAALEALPSHPATEWPAAGPVWWRADVDAALPGLLSTLRGGTWEVAPVPVPSRSRDPAPATPRAGRAWEPCR